MKQFISSLLVTLAVLSSAATSMAQADQRSTIALDAGGVTPEGIDYLERSKTFYVGSFANGSIQTVTNGQAKILQPAGTDGRAMALGIKVDDRRDRLWLVDGKAIYTYSISTNVLIKKTNLSEIAQVKESLLNDIALDKNGNAYITDSFNPHIIRVDTHTLQAKVFIKVSATNFGNQNGLPYNLNGIVFTPDEQALLAVKTNDGNLWRIDLKTRSLSLVQLSEPLTKGDGLVWGKGQQLYIIRNFENKISMVDFSEASPVKTVRSILPHNVQIPTTAVFVNDSLVVVNSQMGVTNPAPYTLAIVKTNQF